MHDHGVARRGSVYLLGAVPKNSTPGKLTYICHFECVGTETNKFEKCEFIFILTRRPHVCWLLHIMLGFFSSILVMPERSALFEKFDDIFPEFMFQRNKNTNKIERK